MEYCVILYLTKVPEIEKNIKIQVYNINHNSEEIIALQQENRISKQKENLRLQSAYVIEKIATFLLPLYNIIFPITYFMVCTLQGPR